MSSKLHINSTTSPNNIDDNAGWINIPTKKQKSKPKNYDDIPTSFKKIKDERKQAVIQSSTPQIQQKSILQNKMKNIEANNILNKIDEGTYTQSIISISLSKQIIKARQEKGWTQKELAQRINEKSTVVSQYESGQAVPNPEIINKLERALGTKLRGSKKGK